MGEVLGADIDLRGRYVVSHPHYDLFKVPVGAAGRGSRVFLHHGMDTVKVLGSEFMRCYVRSHSESFVVDRKRNARTYTSPRRRAYRPQAWE
jgi:hypothetical protein